MADPLEKVTENVDGPYFVTEDCICCGICVDTAPSNFEMNGDESHAYVFKQPGSDEEKKACDDALDSCPNDAIGNNA